MRAAVAGSIFGRGRGADFRDRFFKKGNWPEHVWGKCHPISRTRAASPLLRAQYVSPGIRVRGSLAFFYEICPCIIPNPRVSSSTTVLIGRIRVPENIDKMNTLEQEAIIVTELFFYLPGFFPAIPEENNV
jgi:hypothetical protein